MFTILFIVVMGLLLIINTERWWLWFFLIIGLAVQAGYQIGMFGIAVSIGVSKVLKDLFRAS